jgi:NAD(P)H dehydrogenase (quinone)
MNVLIVHAHENEQSFCSALKNRAKEYYTSNGHTVEISDLYRMNFNPVAGKHDFKSLSGESHYKVQKEQVYAFQHDQFVPELKREMEKLERANIVIFSFPLWWFSLPAILKGWVDRVFAMGFAYGAGKGVYENGVFPEKKALLTFTTGGPEIAYKPDGKNGDIDKIVYHINHGMLYFVGMQTLPPFIVYGASRLSDDERHVKLDEYEEYLENLDRREPIYA